jgi:hypothetical protein
VFGISTAANGRGVHGQSNATNAIGVYGSSSTGYAVYGGTSTGTAVTGDTTNPSGDWAGYFYGNVNVTGSCCGAGAGTYKIDHPLDPENKYLVHSAVESPDMKSVYDGNVTTDAKGNATVVLPNYFEALNRDFRYQLTVVGEFAQAVVSSKIRDNRFTIRTDKPNIEVSWQVTGIRQDPYANAHRIVVEQDKPANEQGKYLHPTEWGQPASSGIDYERRQQLQEAEQTKP